MNNPQIFQKSPQSVPLMRADLNEISKYHNVWFKMACKVISKKNCEDEANELIQETYLKLYDYFQKKEVESISSLYIFKAIRNLYYNHLAKKKYEFATDDKTVFESIDDTQELLELIKDSLEEIPYLEREVLLQHQEKSQRQLQRETGVSRDRLRVHKNRGMEKLTRIVKEKLKTA